MQDARKLVETRAGEPASMDKVSRLATRLKVAEQGLETEKEKVRVLEREIEALKEGRETFVNRFKVRGEIIDYRDETITTVRGRVKVLEGELERKELVIIILSDIIKLSSLSFTEKR